MNPCRRLDVEFAESVPFNAVLFLMARHPGGGPPVAAQRIDAPRFPLAFSIGSEDRMMAAIPFAGPLRISARIDADGNATTRGAGDLLGSSPETHEPGDRGVVVLISEVQTMESVAGALPAAATEAISAAIEGTLELAPNLMGRVPPGAVLFVIARTAGSGPPLVRTSSGSKGFSQARPTMRVWPTTPRLRIFCTLSHSSGGQGPSCEIGSISITRWIAAMIEAHFAGARVSE